MAKYIKLDAIKARLEDLVDWCQDLRKPGLEQALAMLNEEPVADVATVVHGRWLCGEDYMFCSKCGMQWNYCDNDTQDFKYCPNCGAKMNGGDNDATDRC